MEGIVNYLRSKDEATVTMAAQCVDLLASNPCNRKDLFHQKDLISNIVKLTESECEAIQRFALSAAQSLNRYATSTGTNNENSANCDNVAIEKPDAVEKSPDAGDADACADEEERKNRKNEKKKKKKKRKTRTHVLQVSGMNDEAIISRIENELIRVRGVISLTLDQQRGEVIITSKKKRDAILPKLKAAIESAGAELGVQKAPAAAPATTISTANADADADDDGDYLDDDAYFTSREGVLSQFGSSTLQSRLAAQRRKQEELRNKQDKVSAFASKAGEAARWAGSWLGW